MSLSKKEAIAQVAAESPPLGAFPREGLRPSRDRCGRGAILAAAGWPMVKVPVGISHGESIDSKGWHRPQREDEQIISIVPAAWLVRFAELMGKPLAQVCDGKYES